MELYLMGPDFQIKDLVQSIGSLIWTERYNEPGDFELVMPFQEWHLQLARYYTGDHHLKMHDRPTVMIIEQIEITNSRDGFVTKMSGRSMEAALERRIALEYFWVKAPRSVMDQISHVVNWSFGNSATVSTRRLPSVMAYQAPTAADRAKFVAAGLHEMGSDHMEDYAGRDVLDIIQTYAKAHNFGFSCKLDTNGQPFVTQLYWGTDRSLDQTSKPVVMFSSYMGNIDDSLYRVSTSSMKNWAWLLRDEFYYETPLGIQGKGVTPTGYHRRETAYEFNSLPEKDPNDNPILASTRKQMMVTQGRSRIQADGPRKEDVEASTTMSNPFIYREHYGLGDIVELSTDFGINRPVRVVEHITSVSSSETSEYPTFAAVEE